MYCDTYFITLTGASAFLALEQISKAFGKISKGRIFANFHPTFKASTATMGGQTAKRDQIFVEGPLGNSHTKHQDDKMTGGQTIVNLSHPVSTSRAEFSPFLPTRPPTFKASTGHR